MWVQAHPVALMVFPFMAYMGMEAGTLASFKPTLNGLSCSGS